MSALRICLGCVHLHDADVEMGSASGRACAELRQEAGYQLVLGGHSTDCFSGVQQRIGGLHSSCTWFMPTLIL